MTQVSDRLRARVIDVAIEEATRRLPDRGLVFSEILADGSKGEELQKFFQGLQGQRQGLRFLEVCYRHDNPKAWADFLAHEAGKKDSPWQKRAVERFCQRLPVWWSSMEENSQVNQDLTGALQRFTSAIGALELTAEEYQRWRLTLLRRVLRHLLREEAA